MWAALSVRYRFIWLIILTLTMVSIDLTMCHCQSTEQSLDRLDFVSTALGDVGQKTSTSRVGSMIS